VGSKQETRPRGIHRDHRSTPEIDPSRKDVRLEEGPQRCGELQGLGKVLSINFPCVDVNAHAQDSYLIPINDGLTEAKWDKQLFLKQLVIEDKKRELLKSLVENRLNGKLQSMGDLVGSKGKGIIVVLHGPPGMGKTPVAESIAEFVERPLKYVSVAEIIANPKTIEGKSRDMFDKCAEVHGLLLMDEARSIEDFRRNAVVTSKYDYP
jgi:hypothetical protein